jgi:NAD-dependent dihydropyrimidine dehydrogenase PreA subunit
MGGVMIKDATQPTHKPWEALSLAEIGVRDHRPVELTLDNCIKCNICVTACPVTAVTDLFPGPKYEGTTVRPFSPAGATDARSFRGLL